MLECEAVNDAFVLRYSWFNASQKKRELSVCAGCGKLLRSVCVSGAWQWRHVLTQAGAVE